MTLLSKCWFWQHTWQTESPCRHESWQQQCSVTNYLRHGDFKDTCNEIKGLSSTRPLNKYYEGLEFRRKNSSRPTFKDAWEPCNNIDCSFTSSIRSTTFTLMWPLSRGWFTA